MSKVMYEGWMVRYGRRKIGKSYIHKRYFVLETRLLAYNKKKPQDNVVPVKTLLVDSNCRVEDRGLKTQHGHGSWIVRQSVGSTPCLLGKAVDCNYIRGPTYLEVDIDIGSSTVANGVLWLVIGVITTLVVDMAFLVQANTPDELPERLIGAVRVSHAELSFAIVPKLEPDAPS